ncbi:PAS domain-containing protein [Bosea caraganae]|uniref:histidine kinase n=1 Tax=Bosea caraganae TaxID=2763117 RepID=A0A370LCV8_9HYPH|nr:ATP-binding protein [Bosea caraganae]RDJ27794.1 PAS domain-containing protein [Bosea caraganae]RDJ29807.1 PAS domain-containing protein [Bosea caraganae]
MTRRWRRLELAATVAAILVFAALLGWALLRLVNVERAMHRAFGEDAAYALSQAQFELQELTRIAALGPAAELSGQFDIAVSRLVLLREGDLGSKLAALGFPGEAGRIEAALLKLEPLLVRQPGPELGAAFSTALSGPVENLRNMANTNVLSERNRLGQQRDAYRLTLYEIIACILGILLTGCFLVARLLHNLGRAEAADETLRQEKHFLHLLIESSKEGIVAFDKDLRCTHWNSAMAAIFRRPASEVVGADLRKAFPFPEDHVVSRMLRQTLAGEDFYMSEHLMPGTSMYLEKASFPVRSRGEVVGGVVIIRDVTVRALAQHELARHHEELEHQVEERTASLNHTQVQLRSAINTAPDGFAAFDADGRLIVANEVAAEMFKAEPGLFAPGTPLDSVLARTGFPQAGTLSAEERRAVELLRPQGVWLLASLNRAADGSSVLRFADVTTYKHAAAALQSALAQEQSLRQLYTGFVSMVSHQFRTPLAIIDSGAQRMQRRGATMTAGEIETRTGKIRHAAMRLARLVDNTLNAARLDAGEIDFHPRPCDLAQLISDVCERQQELTPHRRFDLALANLPERVSCDALLMDQALANLVSNAAKYSPDDQPIIVDAATDDRSVTLTVRDRGIGIPEDEIPRLFERFFRARTAAGIEGTGMGLHFAREIVHLHGGSISVSSRQGHGAAFTVTLPRERRTGV